MLQSDCTEVSTALGDLAQSPASVLGFLLALCEGLCTVDREVIDVMA